jgi:uncharacterized damage-inducible protein DinB
MVVWEGHPQGFEGRMDAKQYFTDIELEFGRLKRLAEDAIAQVSDEAFFQCIDSQSNSIAMLVKHVAGNLRSRWRDFLTADGEKPDRHRDTEFVMEATDTREELLGRWQRAWALLFETLGSLSPNDLQRTVSIRGEAHSVPQALNRALSHYAAHTGQIVLLAKHWAGERWQTLSIPRGQSDAYDENPTPYMRASGSSRDATHSDALPSGG